MSSGGMGRPTAAIQLEKKYARVLGRLDVLDREVEPVFGFRAIMEKWDEITHRKRNMQAELVALEFGIRQFEPDWDRMAVKAVQTRPRTLKIGQGSDATWDVLREADGRSMTLRELAKAVGAKLGLENPSLRDLQRMSSIVDGLCRRHPDLITRIEGKPNCYVLAVSSRPASASRRSTFETQAAERPSA